MTPGAVDSSPSASGDQTEKHAEDTTSHSSNSSNSSSSDPGDQEEDAQHVAKMHMIECFGQDPKGARPLVHLTRDHVEGRPVPYCRKEPFATWPKLLGVGIEELQACDRPICPTCALKVELEEGIDVDGEE